jgi:YVTN family beta-propeller protein
MRITAVTVWKFVARWTPVVVWACATLTGFIAAGGPADGQRVTDGPLSPEYVAAAPGEDRLFIAEADAARVALLDLASGRVERTLATTGSPTGLALSPDRQTLYVTCAGPAGAIDVFDARGGTRIRTLHAGHTPMAPVLSPDGQKLYVCNRFDNTVSVLAAQSERQIAEIRVVREPVAAAAAPDGRRLIVANHLPAGPADGRPTAAVVSVIDTTERRVSQVVALPNGSTGLRGVCVSPDGKYAYVTHILARYAMPTTQLDRGWMNTNALSILDLAAGTLVNTVLLDDIDRGAANPWGVACSADGGQIYVAHAGTNEISVIDLAGLHAKLARAAAGERVSEVSASSADVPMDLSFLRDIRHRVKLAGIGPRGIAVAGDLLLVAEYFSDSLGVIGLAPGTPPATKSIPLGPATIADPVRRGEMLFNDATICFQQWQSCASCHPDGRADGLNWDLLNDGIGNAKNTKSLLKSHETPPVMALGARSDAEVAVRAGIRHILQASRPEADAAALDAYLRAMPPVPSPRLRSGKLSQTAERGRAIFESAGCAACHAGPLYSDGKPYDIGTGEPGQKFDTPTLIEVWRTAPYLHDGRAANMEDVLGHDNKDDQHGRTSNLAPEERAALVEYVLSL